MRRRALLGWVAGSLALALGCHKPPPDAPEASKAEAAAVRPDAPILTEEPTPERPFVANAALRPAAASVGEVVELVVEARTAPGWHIYAPGCPPEGAAPTSLEVKLPEGVEPAGEWQYPRAEPGPGGQGRTYAGRLTFRRLLKITDKARPAPIEVQCELTYQACDPFRCLPPETRTLSARGEVLSR
jgi:DsbC/DsbD-like thiol-disulfide interchange protein